MPVGVLAELADSCVAVQGQSDQTRLLQPARQREALDRYAGASVTGPLARYQRCFEELAAVATELEGLLTRAQERAQEAERLRFGLEQVAAVDPQPGESEALAVEEIRLGSADTLRAAAETARAALMGDETAAGGEAADALALLGAARGALEQAGVDDPELTALAGRLREVGYLVADLGADLASYAAGIDVDPVRLAAVQERRAALTRLVRTYGADGGADSVLEWARVAAGRLAELDGSDDRIETLRARRHELTVEMGRLAGEVSAARQDAAARFADAVTRELAALAMPNAALEVAVTQAEVTAADSEALEVGRRRVAYGRHGVDDVELLLRPHAGAPSRPVQKGASGGELSRVMLAIEVVFAGADPVPTFVFDEVDAGGGGKAAVEVGRRLAALARTAQVVVVTHLPQVAAYADRHLVVRKADDGAVTRSGVVVLNEAERQVELARMLAGQEGSRAAKAHARELLAAARAG